MDKQKLLTIILCNKIGCIAKYTYLTVIRYMQQFPAVWIMFLINTMIDKTKI
jgi:hypothetical protein